MSPDVGRPEPVASPDRERWLAQVLIELAATMVGDFDLSEVLTTVGERCVELLGAADVGVVLIDEAGGHRLVAASNEARHLSELTALQDVDGPCRDVARHGSALVNAVLSAERWPRFAPVARRHGYKTVHGFPLRHRDAVIGGLCVLDRSGRTITDETATAVQTLADIAAIAMLHHRAAERTSRQAEQLQQALSSRVAIEQAKGILSERLGIDVAEAFEMMRTHARSHNQKLAEVSAAVIAGSLGAHQLGSRADRSSTRPHRDE